MVRRLVRIVRFAFPQERVRRIGRVRFFQAGIDKYSPMRSFFAIHVLHRAPKKPGRKLPETQAMLHYLIAEEIRIEKRRKLYPMYQRIEAFHSFSAAHMAQGGVVS